MTTKKGFTTSELIVFLLGGTILLLAVMLYLISSDYKIMKAKAATYETLYYDALKINTDLQALSGRVEADKKELAQALQLSERKTQILSLAQRILKTSERRCKLNPDRAYDLAIMFIEVGTKEGVPGELLAAVADRESCFRQNAKGGAGEIGMMQVKPTTAFLYGFDPRILKTAYGNVTVSARILATELAKHSPKKALLVYNQGHSEDIGGTYDTGVMATYRKLGGK